MKKGRITKEKFLKHLIIIYFIIFPIFDLVFFYNHVTTLIRIAFLLIFVILTIVFIPNSRKAAKFLIAYYLAMITLLLIGYFHSKGFISLVPGNLDYNIITEAATFLKLCMPFTVLFIMKFQNITKDEFFKIINAWILIIAGSIVFLNLCGYSFATYTNTITNYSILDWPKGLSVEQSATKGFFMYANQEAIILLMLLILSSYEVLDGNKKCSLLTIVVALAMIMLGTRISTLGGLLSIIFIVISYCTHSFIFKKKLSKNLIYLLCIIFGWFLLLPFSPNNDRVEVLEKSVLESNNNSYDFLDQDLDDYEYFLSKFNHVVFNDAFFTVYYPYQYDPDFWLGVVNSSNPPSNYRTMEILILKRIWEIDGRWTNYLFGLSNSRVQNVVNIEMDFVLQFFTFGIVGMIITLSYYIYSFMKCFSIFVKKRSFMSFIILLCLGLFVLASFLSGNSINFLATIVPGAFVFAAIGKYDLC